MLFRSANLSPLRNARALPTRMIGESAWIVPGIQSTPVRETSGIVVETSEFGLLADLCRLLPKLWNGLGGRSRGKTAGRAQENRLSSGKRLGFPRYWQCPLVYCDGMYDRPHKLPLHSGRMQGRGCNLEYHPATSSERRTPVPRHGFRTGEQRPLFSVYVR